MNTQKRIALTAAVAGGIPVGLLAIATCFTAWRLYFCKVLPWSSVAALAASVGIGLLVSAVWALLFIALLMRYGLGSAREDIAAGEWVLRRAFGRVTPSGQTGYVQTSGKTVRRLEQWMNKLHEDYNAETSAQNEELARDLQLAKDFQQTFLGRAYQKIPAVHLEGRLRLEFSHRYEPALALGGDFFDITTLAQDCAGVFVADVMGHGTRSALITAILRTLMDDLQHHGRNARHFLTEMNKQFCQLLRSAPDQLFTSAFYFVADTTARVATYSSAGHPFPFHVRRNLGRISRLEMTAPCGAALGLLQEEVFTGAQCRLVDGDLFILFTDGAYEAHNAQGDEYGLARMEQVIRQSIYRSGKEILDALMRDISEFTGNLPVADDICLVAVDVTTRAEPVQEAERAVV